MLLTRHGVADWPVAMPGYEIGEADVIDQIDEVASGSGPAEMILSCDKLLFF